MIGRTVAIGLAALVAAFACAAEPPADGPTADEVAALHLANSQRQDSQRADARISTMLKRRLLPANISAWNHIHAPPSKMAPLVFNPRLMTAARSLLRSGPRPVDKTPNDFAAAMKSVGYTPDARGCTLIGLDCRNLEVAYAAAILFPIAEKTVNQTTTWPVFARAEALRSEWREAGVAVATAGGKTSLVVILGTGSAKRYLGGTVYADANHNGDYDQGEGKGGITVSAGGATTTTGAGGAWWLALDKDEAVEVAFAGEGAKTVRPAPKGTANLGLDWRLPLPADLKEADKLIADADKVAKETDLDKKRRPLAALISGTRGLCLDDERQKHVDELVQPVRIEFEDTIKNTLSALSEDQAGWKKRTAELQKPWKGGLAGWFKEADAVYKMRQQVNTVLAAPAEQQAKLAAPLQKPLAKALTETTDPAFIEQLRLWQEDIDQAAAIEEDRKAAEKKKDKK
ncbi:MAG: hypothetical protein L6R48_17740 [Planctomycetes bacterium]|nr:hypothetical protein [Planctomycetota bacterium]